MENKDWQCQPRGKAEDCQIDHEQASTNNESLYTGWSRYNLPKKFWVIRRI
jgi:hypothetical protein